MMDSMSRLFEHELEDIYYAEHKLVKALEDLAGESTSPAIKQAFSEHKTQTEGHVKRLDHVFEALGEKPSSTKCAGIEGLIEEKRDFAKEKPAPEVLDLFNLGAGLKSERYEISAYEGLIAMARQMGLREAEHYLMQNLSEEEQALSTVKVLMQSMLPQSAVASRR